MEVLEDDVLLERVFQGSMLFFGVYLGGGFKYVSCSNFVAEDSHFGS